MHRPLIPLLAAAITTAGCGANPTDGVLRVDSMTTDGEAAYVVLKKSAPGSLVVRFDTDGDTVWERQIGPSRDGGYLHGGYLWVVEDVPLGEESSPTEPDRLLKMDPETGQILESVQIGAATGDPTLLIDGQLWLLSYSNRTFEILDLDTLEIVETLDVRTGQILERPDADLEGVWSPVRIEDRVYFIANSPTSIVEYSIDRREINRVLPANEMRITQKLEVHGGELWIPDAGNRRTMDGWLAHRVDRGTFDIEETVPFLASPMWSLTTDDHVFDQTAYNRFEETAEMIQIERTGKVVRTIEGERPQFVLDDHLWLANLERVRLD